MIHLKNYLLHLEYTHLKTVSGLRIPKNNGNPDAPISESTGFWISDDPNARLINQDGTMHTTASEIGNFDKNSDFSQQLLSLLTMDFEESYDWMCAPVFRDAVVFYNHSNEISGILHICFDCDAILNQKEELLAVDYKIFPRLKALLSSVGHPVDE